MVLWRDYGTDALLLLKYVVETKEYEWWQFTKQVRAPQRRRGGRRAVLLVGIAMFGGIDGVEGIRDAMDCVGE